MRAVFTLILTWLFANGAIGAELETILYSGLGQLCSVSPTGTAATCLKAEKEFSSPAWQPKGNRIVVEAGQHDADKVLELLDSHARKIRTLDKSSGFIRPTWSPDGRYIYAVSYSIGTALGRWDSHGKNFARIPISGMEGSRYAQMLSFSPSGKRLAILNSGFNGIYLVRLTSQGLVTEKTIPTGFRYVSGNAWLDERRLLFFGKQNDGPSGLWELDTNDDRTKPIGISQLSLRDFLALSPDKKSVVVCATKEGEALSWNLWKYVLDGSSSPMHLTTGQEDVSPNWRE